MALGLILVAGVFLTLGGCDASHLDSSPSETTLPGLDGIWRATLESPGGELPFGLRIESTTDGYRGFVLNGTEEAPLSSVEVDGDQVELDISWFDSKIVATLVDERLVGIWRRNYPSHVTQLNFQATRGAAPRFGAIAADPGVDTEIAGAWRVTFADEDGESLARAEFNEREGRVTGTFLTPTGDYRFLEGSWQDGVLRLSTFDGAHAFLFAARGISDGKLEGDFWSRDTYHASWSAEREAGSAAAEALPDPWSQVTLNNSDGQFHFSFEDLEGNRVADYDETFKGKVVVVNLFGSWCPNCNDEAPLLAEWARNYRERGLEIVGLAYEFSPEVETAREMVGRFAQRHGIDYQLLVAGVSDKAEAGATVPDLSAVLAYPTTLFIGRDGRVRRIHSGFAGPGTGDHHQRLVEEMTTTLEALLKEPASAEST